MLYADITEKIIGIFYRVHAALGYGFLEKVYENAMMIELQKQGIPALQQHNLKVYYEETVVGDYFADILIPEKIIIELKAAKSISEDHYKQLLNYLKATPIEIGLLLNFGIQAQPKRVIFTNDRKPFLKHIFKSSVFYPSNP